MKYSHYPLFLHTATTTSTPSLINIFIWINLPSQDILYQQRAKLFVYGENLLDKDTGVKMWNERGVGDCKLLKHRETNHIRILMRQEKTMKIIGNRIVKNTLYILLSIALSLSLVLSLSLSLSLSLYLSLSPSK